MNDLIHTLNSKLNFRRFLAFSVVVFPLAATIGSFISGESAPVRLVASVCAYVIFSLLNHLWSQGHFRFTIVLLSLIFGVYWLGVAMNGFDFSAPIDYFATSILYLVLLPLFLVTQFTAWVPHVLRLQAQDGKLQASYVILAIAVSLAGYLGFGLLYQTIAGG
jgi:hypothetical protein